MATTPLPALAPNRPVSSDLRKLLVLLLVLPAVGLAYAAAYRLFGIGRDYMDYYGFWLTVTPFYETVESRFEPGFITLAWLFSNVFETSFEFFYFSVCIFALLFKIKLFSNYLRSPVLAFLAYILLFYVVQEYTQIRLAIAIPFGFLGVHALLERRWFAFLLWSCVAYFLHASTILLALGALGAVLVPIRLQLIALAVSAATAILAYSLLETLIATIFSDTNPLVARYLSNLENAEAANPFSGTNLLIYASLAWITVAGWSRRDPYITVFFTMAVAGIASIFVFAQSPVFSQRTSELFLFSIIFLGYRLPFGWRTAGPQVLILLAGVWSTYRAFELGTIG
jgi:hypothetical protein